MEIEHPELEVLETVEVDFKDLVERAIAMDHNYLLYRNGKVFMPLYKDKWTVKEDKMIYTELVKIGYFSRKEKHRPYVLYDHNNGEINYTESSDIKGNMTVIRVFKEETGITKKLDEVSG